MMKKNNILSITVYIIITIICLFYFYNSATAYEHINSLPTFIGYTLSLLLALCIFIFSLLPTNRIQYIFKLTIAFTLLIGGVVLTFELVKPDYTYTQAKKMIEEEYNVVIIESEVRVMVDGISNKQIYKINALENSQKIEFSFNPYSKKIVKIE